MIPEIFTIIVQKNKRPHYVKFRSAIKAYLYYKSYRVDLLNKRTRPYSLDKFWSRLNEMKINQNFTKPIVYHLFYELGYLFNGLKELIPEDSLLAVEIHYEKVAPYNLAGQEEKISLQMAHSPNYFEYKKSFYEGYRNLLDGNCYQFNLTFPHCFTSLQKITPDHFISKLWNKIETCGDYAHCTVIPALKKMFVSNSPECLFQIIKRRDGFKLWTMPIKGSLKLVDEKDWKEKWKRLCKSRKNEAELFMISDLLRNDLSSIERPNARIVRKKTCLKVPGILHQYSLIDVDLTYKVTLGKIISSLFPGGSVTGAPKKKVMRILKAIEKSHRGIYCGSTIILFRDILAASINIRSAEVDYGNLKISYGAGGGITLLSEVKQEFEEMKLKVESFISLISE